jgi:hypothetical protein
MNGQQCILIPITNCWLMHEKLNILTLVLLTKTSILLESLKGARGLSSQIVVNMYKSVLVMCWFFLRTNCNTVPAA